MSKIILALAAEADDTFLWNRIRDIQAGMFAAGPVEIKFAYFGREGASQVRPYITTRWVTNPSDMRDVMDRGRAGCVCGCYVDFADILEQAVREAQRAPVPAVVIVGDHFRESDQADALARELRKLGTRVFLIQCSRSAGHLSAAVRALAETTGGACLALNPAVERVAGRLPGMLEAVSHLAIGGTAGLQALAQSDDEAARLLEQVLEHALPHTS
jgi:hypothetical protein